MKEKENNVDTYQIFLTNRKKLKNYVTFTFCYVFQRSSCKTTSVCWIEVITFIISIIHIFCERNVKNRIFYTEPFFPFFIKMNNLFYLFHVINIFKKKLNYQVKWKKKSSSKKLNKQRSAKELKILLNSSNRSQLFL